MDRKGIVNDLFQAAVISVFAVGYSMLGKKILKMTPPSIQNLIKQKILPDHINVNGNGDCSDVNRKCVSKRISFDR